MKALEPALADEGESAVILGAAKAASELKVVISATAASDEILSPEQKRVTRYLEFGVST